MHDKPPQIRADSGYYRQDVIAAALAAKASFSVTVRMNPSVRQAITAIAEDAWTTIKYPHAIWDEQEQRWISVESCKVVYDDPGERVLLM